MFLFNPLLPDDLPNATLMQYIAGGTKADALQRHSQEVRDAAELSQLARLSRVTHLDLGLSSDMAALAPLLPDLQSFVVHLLAKSRPASAADLGC